jgi:hypothetical protein
MRGFEGKFSDQPMREYVIERLRQMRMKVPVFDDIDASAR